MQNGYQQDPRVENDGAVHVASTETVTTATTSALNTSTEYAFETNLFEDQYYDVTVGSTVSVQSDNQVKVTSFWALSQFVVLVIDFSLK